MPATIRPAVRSLLTRSAAAAGGVVHGDVTFATCGDWRSSSTIRVPVARAAALSTPSGAETTISSWTSPWWNLSVNSSVALEDSARRVLESAGGQGLGDRHPEDAERDGEQRRDGDDSTRRGDGQPGDAV